METSPQPSPVKNPTRIDPLAPPPLLEEPVQDHLVWFIPPAWKPVIAAVVLVASTGTGFFGVTTKIGAICSVIVGVGAALGIVSTGVRR